MTEPCQHEAGRLAYTSWDQVFTCRCGRKVPKCDVAKLTPDFEWETLARTASMMLNEGYEMARVVNLWVRPLPDGEWKPLGYVDSITLK